MRRLLPTLLMVVLPASLLAGCGSSDDASGSDQPLVVATTTQVADFVREVGGDDVEVYAMLRPNVDAHDFEPSPQDLDALSRADAIFANGVGLEPWLDDAVTASGTSEPVVDTSRGTHLILTDADADADEDGHVHTEDDGHDHEGDANPHIWFDPTNAQQMVANIADTLAEVVPDAATQIDERAAAYSAELTELDSWISEQIDGLDDTDLVTDHDAFPYYVERYGLVFVGSIIPSFDTAAEISAGDLNDLAATIEDAGVAAIFTEQSLPPKAAETIARRTGVEVVSGDDGLYGDSLGPEGSDGDTYTKMMRHNTESIVEHLS